MSPDLARRLARPARSRARGGRSWRAGPSSDEQAGVVTLEWVLALPLLALAVAGVLEVGGVVRDALLVHDAARVGVRAAATSTGAEEVRRAVGEVLIDAPADVQVDPVARHDGDLVRVTVGLQRSFGPVTHRLRATAVARVEPVVTPAAPT